MITNSAQAKNACPCTTDPSHSRRHPVRQSRCPWTRRINDNTERDIARCAMIDGLATIANQLSMVSTAECVQQASANHQPRRRCTPVLLARGDGDSAAPCLEQAFHRSDGDDDELMRISIEVTTVSKSQKQHSRTRTQRPGLCSLTKYGVFRAASASSSFRPLNIRLHHYATPAFAQRPTNPHSEYLEVVASHRRRCCKRMDLRLALFCKPPRSKSVPLHYPSSPVVQRDRFPTSECGELTVTQRIARPRKSTSVETREYVPERSEI